MKSQTTSGTHKMYKPGQLLTIDNKLFRVMKKPLGADYCDGCYFSKRKAINKGCNMFCYYLPRNCKFVLNDKVAKHKG